MKRLWALLLVSGAAWAALPLPAVALGGELTVKIQGVRDDQGTVRLALYGDARSFPNPDDGLKIDVPAQAGEIEVTFEDPKVFTKSWGGKKRYQLQPANFEMPDHVLCEEFRKEGLRKSGFEFFRE